MKILTRLISSVWINIANDGDFERVAAFEGESLLTSLKRAKVAGLPGIKIIVNFYNLANCDGGELINTILERPIDIVTYGPFCGHCKVIISNPWFKKLEDQHPTEETQLSKQNELR